MKFRQVALPIKNVARATAFYTELLGKQPLAVFDPPGFAFFDLEGVRLFLDVNALPGLIYLQVDSVRDKVEDLRAKGIKIIDKPHVVFPDPTGVFDTPGDEWLAFFEDSEGNQVGLMSRG